MVRDWVVKAIQMGIDSRSAFPEGFTFSEEEVKRMAHFLDLYPTATYSEYVEYISG